MKKIIVILFALALLLAGCESGGDISAESKAVSEAEESFEISEISETEESSEAEKTVFPLENEVYSYENEENILDFVYFGDGICFRFYPKSEAENADFAFTYQTGASVSENTLTAEYKGDFSVFSLTFSSETAKAEIKGETEVFSGEYKAIKTEKKEYPAPEFPKIVLDKNCEAKLDVGIANAVRAEYGLSENAYLSREFLLTVTDLSLFEDKLVSLTGIENLENLDTVYIMQSYLTDITPLLTLPRIKNIDLGWSYVKELPEMDENCKVERLSVTNACVADLAPLARAVNLKSLDVSQNFIKSIAPLKDLENLEFLGVWGNCILDWETVKDNKSLIDALAALDYDYDLAVKAVEKAKEISSEIIKENMTELQKEKACYDYIRDNMDYGVVHGFMKPFGYQALFGKKGVCGHYSEGLTLLLNVSGLEAISISSDTHAWNMVKIGENFYHADALWDEDCGQYPSYFNVGTEEMMGETDHVHDLFKYPAACKMHPLVYAREFGNVIK